MAVSLVQSNKAILSSGRIHDFEVGLKEDFVKITVIYAL